MNCLWTARWSWICVNTCNSTINSILSISMAIITLHISSRFIVVQHVLSIQGNTLGWRHISIKTFSHWPLHCLFQIISIPTRKRPSKLYITGHLCWESTGYRWTPCTKGQQCGKRFLIMTSSCASTLTHIWRLTRISEIYCGAARKHVINPMLHIFHLSGSDWFSCKNIDFL